MYTYVNITYEADPSFLSKGILSLVSSLYKEQCR